MTDAATEDLTDGFHLIIDALKLNDLSTIYGVPGIPITDFGRMAQAEGFLSVTSNMRVMQRQLLVFWQKNLVFA